MCLPGSRGVKMRHYEEQRFILIPSLYLCVFWPSHRCGSFSANIGRIIKIPNFLSLAIARGIQKNRFRGNFSEKFPSTKSWYSCHAELKISTFDCGSHFSKNFRETNFFGLLLGLQAKKSSEFLRSDQYSWRTSHICDSTKPPRR